MNSTGYPDNHNFFELEYCGHNQFPYSKIFLEQASDLILSQFQEEDHPFIIKDLQDDDIHLVSLYYVYKPNTDTLRTKNSNIICIYNYFTSLVHKCVEVGIDISPTTFLILGFVSLS